MQKHPDADAFMRSYLEHPADAVVRLVFADWLDETGEEHNAAWAQFIRLRIEADRHPLDSAERRELDREADTHAPHIRARLTIPAWLFVKHHEVFGQLLPFHRIVVRLGSFRPRPFDAMIISENIARLYSVIPLLLTRSELLIAIGETALTTRLAADDLRNLLNFPMKAVRAARGEVDRAIEATYPLPPATVHSCPF